MAIQKVRILKDDGGSWVTALDCAAQFNPTKLQLSKSASWQTKQTVQSNIGTSTFTGGSPISLSLQLFFDTTATGGDVRQYTAALMDLAMVNVAEASQSASLAELTAELDYMNKHASDFTSEQIATVEQESEGRAAGEEGAPPRCKFVWGNFSFVCILKSVDVTYTVFLPNGTPVRATASVKLLQIEEQSMYPPQNPTTRSAARKTWVVREGETLDWIAHQEYGDPALWRFIAQTNHLDNPRDLHPGQVLGLL